MTFDDWMRTVNTLHQPTDDSMETRLLRQCWNAAVAAERRQLVAAVSALHMAQATNNQNHPSAWHDGVDAALREAENAIRARGPNV